MQIEKSLVIPAASLLSEMEEAANRGGLTSLFATDILDGIVEAFDKIIDPLVLYLLKRAV